MKIINESPNKSPMKCENDNKKNTLVQGKSQSDKYCGQKNVMPNLQTNKQERIIPMKNRLLPQDDQVSAQLKDIFPNNI